MAGGIFSGSSNVVRGSASAAEAAARRAEEAANRAAAAIDALEVYTGQDETDNKYTVPPGEETNDATLFLNQEGEWVTPNTGADGATDLNELTDVTITNEETNQVLRYNGTVWVNSTESDHGITAGTGLNLSNTDVISVEDGGIGTTQLSSNAVTSAKIVDGGVMRVDIADNAINDSKLDATNTGTANQILSATGSGNFTWVDADGNTAYTASDGITLASDDFSLTDSGVTTAKINDDAVTSAKIADDNVTADELNVTGDGTSGQILSSDGDGSFSWKDEATATTYTADEDTLTLSDSDVFSVNASGIDTAELADIAVTTAKINNLAVTGAKLANSTVTATKIANDAVETDKINDGAVTSAKIADNAVVADALASNAVTSTKINSGAVTADALNVEGDGTNGQFLASDGDGSFTWTTASGGTQYTADGTTLALSDTNEFSIADAGVDTAQLADDSITAAQVTDGIITAGKLAVTGNGTDGQVLTSDGDGTFTWTTAGSSTTLAGLTDVNVPDGITDRRFLEYNPSESDWDAVSVNDLFNLHELFDVALTNPTNDQFLRYDTSSAKWVNESVSIPGAVAAGTGISVSGSTVSIADDGVTTSKIADSAVRTASIQDGNITTDKLADDAVTDVKILDDTITNAKLADNTITGAKISPNSLGATELATDSVSSFKLQDDAVIAGKIANNVVGADELDVSGDGTSGQFLTSDGDGTFSWTTSSGGVTYTAGTGLNLSDENVFSVPDNGITNVLIADNAVDTAQIAVNAVTGTQLAAGSVDTSELEDDAVTNAKMADNSVDSAEIVTGAVTNAKIATGAVMSASLGSDAVTSVKIIDAAVTSTKLATDIPISTFSDVNTTGVNNGQILTYNGTTWVPTNNSGGGNTDNSRLGITLNPSSLNEADEATSITVTLAIVNMISDETISGQSVTVTDPTGHSVAVSGSGNSFTFMASTANNGNFVVRASATFTTGGTSTVHSSSANLPVIPTPADNINWYQWVTDTQPTAITSTDVVDNGVFSSPETGDWTRPAADTDLSTMAYVALPTGTYTFHAGLLFATITNLGVISTDYTLYRLDDFEQVAVGGTRIITITEA